MSFVERKCEFSTDQEHLNSSLVFVFLLVFYGWFLLQSKTLQDWLLDFLICFIFASFLCLKFRFRVLYAEKPSCYLASSTLQVFVSITWQYGKIWTEISIITWAILKVIHFFFVFYYHCSSGLFSTSQSRLIISVLKHIVLGFLISSIHKWVVVFSFWFLWHRL